MGGDKWKTIKPMSTPRAGAKAVGLEGKLYVVGGWNGNRRLRSGEVYDTELKNWKALPDLNVPRSYFSLVVVNGQLLAFGGYDDMIGNSVTASAEILNWTTNAWEEVGSLPSPRMGLVGVTVPRKILDETFLKMIKSRFESTNVQEDDEDMVLPENVE